MTGMEIIMI